MNCLTLYHTSRIEIRDPDIFTGRKNADFGQGFYLTPDLDFSYRWAWQDAVINQYELTLDDLNIHRFTRTADWFDYIFHNRRGTDQLAADVVIGPIANDTIFDTFGVFSSGFLSPEEALRLLMIGPEYTQVAVKTKKAASRLVWTGSEQFTGSEEYREALKQEQEAYLEQISGAL